MSETLYRKVGRKYEPIAWHEEVDAIRTGVWLYCITANEGCKSISRVKVETGMDVRHIAGNRLLVKELTDALLEANIPSGCDPEPLTEEQKQAVDAMHKAFNDRPIRLEYKSMYDVVEEAVAKVLEQA